jgi:hypothetical protein
MPPRPRNQSPDVDPPISGSDFVGATQAGSRPRITPSELRALLTVMRELGCHDMASGDTRLLISPTALARGTVMAPSDEPLRPIVRQDGGRDTEDDDEELLHASVS